MNPSDLAAWPYSAVFTHRCGGTLAPENTIEGLTVARRLGVGVEFDVMLSASGTPWLIHDETLERTTSGRGRVADTSDRVLASLDAGCRHSADFAGVRLSSFEPAARLCIEYGLDANVEIKPSEGHDERTAQVVAAMADALWKNLPRPPLLSSFSESALRVAARVAPRLPRGLLVGRVPPDWLSRCRGLGVVSLHASARHIRRTDVEAIRGEGVRVVIYTENDPDKARRLFKWGVDTVITDRPDLIQPPGR